MRRKRNEADALLRVYRRDGRWAWCYQEPVSGLELHSNLDYGNRDDAAAAAHRAYPDVEFKP